MKTVTEILRALFEAIVGGFVESHREARRDARLEELGYSRGEIAKSREEREIIKGAREIENRPSGGLRANIERL